MNRFAYTTPWGTIRTGEFFEFLPEDEQRAVLAHERGHLARRHHLKRLSWFVTLRVFFRTDAFLRMCEEQEIEADSYARDTGHGPALAKFITKHVKMTAFGYPSVIRRLENLHG
jgi:hypothetical protein